MVCANTFWTHFGHFGCEPLCVVPIVSKLQEERDDLMLHLIFTKGVTEDLQSNAKVMKNVRSKVGAERTRAEEQKLKQVL